MGKWFAAQLNVIAVTVIRTPVPRVTYFTLRSNQLSYLPTPVQTWCNTTMSEPHLLISLGIGMARHPAQVDVVSCHC